MVPTAHHLPPLPAVLFQGRETLSPGQFRPVGLGVTLPCPGAALQPHPGPARPSCAQAAIPAAQGPPKPPTNQTKTVLRDRVTVTGLSYLQLNHSCGGKRENIFFEIWLWITGRAPVSSRHGLLRWSPHGLLRWSPQGLLWWRPPPPPVWRARPAAQAWPGPGLQHKLMWRCDCPGLLKRFFQPVSSCRRSLEEITCL